MHVHHVNSAKEASRLNRLIAQKKNVFVLVYMDGCGPCNATRPEWQKLGHALKGQYGNMDELVIVEVNKNVAKLVPQIGDVDGFPSLKYLTDSGKTVEPYEDSNIPTKDRSVNSFVSWIDSKMNQTVSTTPTVSATDVYRRLTSRRHRRSSHRSKRRGKKRKSRRTKRR